jgi:hypothetical protein
MTWTWRTAEEILEGFGPLEQEIATNDTGVTIRPWGTWGTHRLILFKYADKDIAIQFTATQSLKSVAEHGEVNHRSARYPLGPMCDVSIDDLQMKFGGRPLSAEETATIKENITDFLTTAFRESRMAVPPYAEQVEIR